MKHIILIALSLFLFANLSKAADAPATHSSTQPAAVHNVGVNDFAKLAADSKNVILDVRTPKEFAAGHLPGAVNINWTDKTFAEKIAALDKSKTYLVHCKIGGRSAKACSKLEEEKFLNVYNLKGGIDAWTEAGKETVKE